MNTTFATRTRPFTSPHPIDNIRSEAVADRDQRTRARTARIKSLVASAPSDNKDEFYWTMVYDLEEAPLVTCRRLLLEHGIIPTPPQELQIPSELHDELWTIIEAMSKSGVYLMNTDHLCDSDLYARLYYRILDEECRDIPPAAEAAEYIDVLHPMDIDYPLGSTMLSRSGQVPTSAPGPYLRGPIVLGGECPCDRDNYLPRPRNL
jgi:hypothetical protein